MANQLSGLPNFTVRVKIGTNAPQNPGKKCLSCSLLNNSGALYCTGCGIKLPAPNEYTIATLKPAGGIGKAAFDQRIAYIQTRNRDPRYGGYCRPRKDVEAEIINRQTACSGSPPAQPQPQQPHRVARQVPVQGNCQTCGASNAPGAKFCNQCGTKL
jgi:Double zinc ribbon